MKIGYVISAYKDPAQLVRLVTRLATGDAAFYIHIDKKTEPAIVHQMRAGLSHLGSVHFLEPHVCHYLGFGHVEASLKGIRCMLAGGAAPDYAVLLTGQDYPIKPVEHIDGFFRQAHGRSYMNHVAMSDPIVGQVWRDALERFNHWHIQGRRRAYYLPPDQVHLRPLLSLTNGPVGYALKHLLPPRKPLAGFPAYGGSGYWNLSRTCVEYVDDFVRTHPAFIRYFRFTRIPDEHFFQTLLCNSPLAETLVDDSLRYIDWTGCTGSSPRTLGSGDLERILASPALFARKFDSSVDTAVLDGIDGAVP